MPVAKVEVKKPKSIRKRPVSVRVSKDVTEKVNKWWATSKERQTVVATWGRDTCRNDIGLLVEKYLEAKHR